MLLGFEIGFCVARNVQGREAEAAGGTTTRSLRCPELPWSAVKWCVLSVTEGRT